MRQSTEAAQRKEVTLKSGLEKSLQKRNLMRQMMVLQLTCERLLRSVRKETEGSVFIVDFPTGSPNSQAKKAVLTSWSSM